MRNKRLGTEPCRVEGCLKPLRRVRRIWYDYLCQLHRDRWTKYRDFNRGRGSLRTADGQLQGRYRKTTINGKSYQAHRIVWRQAYGPIPPDKVIHHIDGNRLNNALDNLAAVTPAEHRHLHG